MSLIPYAGSERTPRTKGKEKLESLALLSLRSEFNSLAARYRGAIQANETLRVKLNTALERIADLESIICRATDALGTPRIDESAHPFAEQANRVILEVADHFGLSPMMIFGRARGHEYTMPRHIAMYLVHVEMGVSKAATGRYFGGRDHTTVIHACRNVRRAKHPFENAAADIAKIQTKLKNAPPGASEGAAGPRPPSGSAALSISSQEGEAA